MIHAPHAEVRQSDIVLFTDQNAGRLDVAMYDVVFVGVLQGRADLRGEAHDQRQRQQLPRLASEKSLQRLPAFWQRGNAVEEIFACAVLQQRLDMRMLAAPDLLYFSREGIAEAGRVG